MSSSTEYRFTLPRRRRLFLMRHGDVTYYDASGRTIVMDDVPLDPQGRDEARAAGHAFAAEQIVFDRVITSGLPRTVETATLVCAALDAGRRPAIEVWPEFREIAGGKGGSSSRHGDDGDGNADKRHTHASEHGAPSAPLSPEQIEAAFLSVFDGVVGEERSFMGGETIGALLDRVLPGLARLRAARDWDTALLVLHGGVNRAVLSHALCGGSRAFFGHIEQHTGCINAIDVGDAPADWVIRLINYCPPTPLHRDARNTTMELIYAEYLKYAPRLA